MKSITRVERQRKNGARRSIFVDDEFAFGVAEETYLRYSLFVGRTLEESEIDEIGIFDEGYRAKLIAMALLDRRLRSIAEIREHLAKKEFPLRAVESTLKYLEDFGEIDDARFAAAYINDRLLKRKIAPGRLRSELRQKGVASEIIDEALAELVDDDRELSLALEAARSKDRRLRDSDRKKRENRIVAFLQSRGFRWSVIAPTLKVLRAEWEQNAAKDS